MVQLRLLVPMADGRAESPGESALRLFWYDAGLPRPELQWWVHDNGVALYRLDLALPDCRFAAEYDGQLFHSRPEDVEHDRSRRSWLDEEGHWVVDVFERGDVYAPGADPGPRLHTGLRTARSRSGLWVPESAYRPSA